MLKYIWVSSFIFLNLPAFAQFDQYIHGLKKELLFTQTQRAVALNQHVKVTKFSLLGRWVNPDASATYNDKLNVISLHEDLLEKVSGKLSIKNSRVLRANGNGYQATTIFHEMGHAELDIFIEDQVNLEDLAVMYHYKNHLKSFYKSNFSGTNPYIIFHEHFAYYRTELIDFMNNELDEIFIQNGFNRNTNSCFLTQNLKRKLANGVKLENFLSFENINSGPQELYRKRIAPRYVFAKGKDIDLETGADHHNILPLTNLLFWNYHQAMYNFPYDRADYLKRLNAESDYVKHLRKCRRQLWLAHYR